MAPLLLSRLPAAPAIPLHTPGAPRLGGPVWLGWPGLGGWVGGVEATDKREQTWKAYPKNFKGKAGGVRKVGSDPPPPMNFSHATSQTNRPQPTHYAPPPPLPQLTHFCDCCVLLKW